MFRGILSITVFLACLMHSIAGWTASIAGDEHVAISESVFDLELHDDVQVTLHKGADVGRLGVTGRSQVIMHDGARVSYLIASNNATITMHAGTEIGYVDMSGNAVAFISGGAIDFLHVLGKSQAHIRHMTTQEGTFVGHGVSVTGGALIYTADASIHIYATDLDFYKGRLTGMWGTGEKFAFWVIERQDAQGDNEIYHLPHSLPRQFIGHDLVVASFDCTKAVTFVEKTICADRVLARLDRRLALLYRQSRTQAPETRELQASQERWLLTHRNLCKNHECIKKSYENRIKELQRILSPHVIPVQLIAPEKAQAVCNEVLKLTNTGQLAQRLMQFASAPEEEDEKWRKLPGTEGTFVSDILDVDYNRDGKKDRLAIIGTDSTCGNSDIVDLGAAIKRGDASGMGYLGFSDEEAENDEDLRWASWGQGDHFLVVHGEPVVVTANFGQKPADVRLVSWFGEGQKRPLCVFAPTKQVQIRILADRHPQLCKAIASGRWKPIAWDGTVSPDEVTMLRSAEHHADSGVTARIDINADGQPDNIALLDYASGAGCGSYRQWLVALSEDGQTMPSSSLNRALQSFQGPMIHHKKPKQWRDIQMFTFAGKPYVLGSSPTYVAGVYSVWKDVLQTWCGFELLEQFKIERLYPLR